MCTSFSGQDFEIQRIEPENWFWRDLKTSKIEKMKDFGGVPCEIDISLLPDISCFSSPEISNWMFRIRKS